MGEDAAGPHRLGVFISWSGDESYRLAALLADWIPRVVQATRPWLSSEDLHGRWSLELGRVLESTSFGLVCVTRSNTDAPWVMFEVGSLAKELETSEVIPILHGIDGAALAGNPLEQFQHAASLDRERMRWMIGRINHACRSLKVSHAVLDDAFARTWDEFASRLQEIAPVEGDDATANEAPSGAVLEQIYGQLSAQRVTLDRIERQIRQPRRTHPRYDDDWEDEAEEEEEEYTAVRAPAPYAGDTDWVVDGMEVDHPAFGRGVVLNVTGDGNKAEATIQFPEVGTKQLALAWAPLKAAPVGDQSGASGEPPGPATQ